MRDARQGMNNSSSKVYYFILKTVFSHTAKKQCHKQFSFLGFVWPGLNFQMSSCDNSSAMVPRGASQAALQDGWMNLFVNGGNNSSGFGTYELIFVLGESHDF